MGRPPIIDPDRVAEAALAIIDEAGVEEMSVGRIAERLGVRGPSLYHHFRDKAAILTEVAKLVIGDLGLHHEAADWQEWMVTNALTLYRRVLAHPRAVIVVLEHLPDDQATYGQGRAARMMSEAGVDPKLQVLIMEGVEKLTWGWALRSAATHQRQLDQKVMKRDWPELADALRANPFDDEAMVEASVRSFLRGALDGHTGAAAKPSRSRRPARRTSTHR